MKKWGFWGLWWELCGYHHGEFHQVLLNHAEMRHASELAYQLLGEGLLWGPLSQGKREGICFHPVVVV